LFRAFRNFVAILAVSGIVLLLSEGAVQSVMTYVLGRGRLFERDASVGWKVRANLDVTRRNPEGRQWNIKTGPCGLRSGCDWRANAIHRLLVLGDSFAFGEGIAVEDRFDTELARHQPDWSIVNLGVMGYGTDQELVAARAFTGRLRANDTVLVLVYGNDFFDILRKRFAGRSKPWFELTGIEIVEHPPAFSWLDRVRDQSYIAAALSRFAEPAREDYSNGEREKGISLFQAMLDREIAGLTERGVKVVLARHGMWLVTEGASTHVRERLANAWDALCADRACLDLDPALASVESQADGHWNAEGHRVVGELLARVFDGVRPHVIRPAD